MSALPQGSGHSASLCKRQFVTLSRHPRKVVFEERFSELQYGGSLM